MLNDMITIGLPVLIEWGFRFIVGMIILLGLIAAAMLGKFLYMIVLDMILFKKELNKKNLGY